MIHAGLTPRPTRRAVLTLAGLAGAALLAGRVLPAAASAGAWQRLDEARALVGEAMPLAEGLVLDLPLVSENGASVPLTVRVERAMAEGVRVESIHLFATANPDPKIAAFHFTPLSGRPEVATRVRLNETQTVVALARLTSGEMLLAEREVRVTVSGCLMVDDTYESASLFQTRLRAPERLAAGEPGEVLSIINHPMETGLRRDGAGNLLKKRIIERLEASLGGETVFTADLNRSVSANPYLRFYVAPSRGGTLDLRWTEDTGESAEAEAEIAVN